MAYCPQANPQALGNVVVASAGTPVQITLTLQSTAAGSGNVVNSATDAVLCNLLTLTSSPYTHSGAGNTGKIYVGQKNMVKGTGAGVYFVLTSSQSVSMTVNVAINAFDANQIYVDADTSGDGLIGALFSI